MTIDPKDTDHAEDRDWYEDDVDNGSGGNTDDY